MVVSNQKLIRVNIGAACLHALLLIAILTFYFKPDVSYTSIKMNEEAPVAADGKDRCRCIPKNGLRTSDSSVDIFWMTVAFTVVTLCAHIFYASNVNNLYVSALESGKNPYRWFEYGLSASLMLSVLSVLSGNRNKQLFVLMFVATFSQMLQGYCIESAVANGGSIVDKVVPLVVGWVLLIGTWYIIYDKWYRSLNYAFDAVAYCDTVLDAPSERPPAFIKHLLNVVFVLFSSFGIVNLAYVVHSFLENAKINFKSYELCYIILSFVAKAILAMWCISSVFTSELLWLQGYGCADSAGEGCVKFERLT